MSFDEKIQTIFNKLKEDIPNIYFFDKKIKAQCVIFKILGHTLLVHEDNVDEIILLLDKLSEMYYTEYCERLNEEREESAIDNGKRKG